MATKKPATKGSKKNNNLIGSTTNDPNAAAKSGKDVKKSMKDYAAGTQMLGSSGSTPKAEAKSGRESQKSMNAYANPNGNKNKKDDSWKRDLKQSYDTMARQQIDESNRQYDQAKSDADRQATSRGMGRSSYNNQILAGLDSDKVKAATNIKERSDAAFQQAAQQQSNWQAQMDFNQQQANQQQENWQASFEAGRQDAAQAQANWQAQFDAQQRQQEWQNEYAQDQFAYQWGLKGPNAQQGAGTTPAPNPNPNPNPDPNKGKEDPMPDPGSNPNSGPTGVPFVDDIWNWILGGNNNNNKKT